MLRQRDGVELSEQYSTKNEVMRAELEHNAKAWEEWEAEQPKAKAS